MTEFAYLGVLLGCLICTALLEIFLRTRVYRRFLRLILTLIPVVIVFAIWDAYAIAAGHWTFGSAYVTGVEVGFNIPLEEICFFIAIPICAILTLEGVRASSKMKAGDEVDSA